MTHSNFSIWRLVKIKYSSNTGISEEWKLESVSCNTKAGPKSTNKNWTRALREFPYMASHDSSFNRIEIMIVSNVVPIKPCAILSETKELITRESRMQFSGNLIERISLNTVKQIETVIESICIFGKKGETGFILLHNGEDHIVAGLFREEGGGGESLSSEESEDVKVIHETSIGSQKGREDG